MMKKYVLAIFLALLTVSSWAQQKSIKILVVDESGAPLSYFNVLVFNPSDYIYITGEVFYEGDLDYENSFTGMKIIKITSLGYKDYALNIDFDNPVYPDKVVMQTTALEIDEVIVEGRRVALKVDKGKTILQVAGSSLANLADIATIINHAPGLQASDNELTVLGRGSPLVYLDGRKVAYSDLKVLSPADILSMEIDRNPSARYDASAKAVIRVKTKRSAESVSGRVSVGADIGREARPIANGQLQVSTPKLYTFLGNDFGSPWFRSTEKYYQSVTSPEYSMADSAFTKTLNKQVVNSFLYNSVLAMSPRSKLS